MHCLLKSWKILAPMVNSKHLIIPIKHLTMVHFPLKGLTQLSANQRRGQKQQFFHKSTCWRDGKQKSKKDEHNISNYRLHHLKMMEDFIIYR